MNLVLCVVSTLQTDFHFGFIHERIVFDPAFFTPTIRECHESCADKYFTCSFITCSEGSLVKNQDLEKKTNPKCCWEVRPTFWSRFLHYFTFGLLGQLRVEQECLAECPYLDAERKLWEGGDKVSDNNHFRCLDKCKDYFHKCYRECVCEENPDVSKCKPQVLYVYPQANPQALSGFHEGNVPANGNKFTTKKPYEFDWKQFMN